MKVAEYFLNLDLESARRFSSSFSVYINGCFALIVGSLHYTATGSWTYSIMLAGLFYWYRYILKRLSIELDRKSTDS